MLNISVLSGFFWIIGAGVVGLVWCLYVAIKDKGAH